MHHSTLGWRVIKKQKKVDLDELDLVLGVVARVVELVAHQNLTAHINSSDNV